MKADWLDQQTTGFHTPRSGRLLNMQSERDPRTLLRKFRLRSITPAFDIQQHQLHETVRVVVVFVGGGVDGSG